MKKKGWNVRIDYRVSRWKGILKFIEAIFKFRPDVVWIVDLKVTGVVAGLVYRILHPHTKLVVDTGDDVFHLSKNMGRNFFSVSV